ncbi:MAG: hypothetical protein BMS9Abin23_0022 [Thermodesulfobacteriota bacterium]|nr:MAG: hypothetical protein BMS9Abin23_0022 [Thermodesulfobacteriota bacterium]
MMNKKTLWIVPALFFWILLTGMGAAPGPEVPIPDIDFRATVTDVQGISTKLANVTWEGKTYFTGSRGKGIVTIGFEKVKKISGTGSAEGNKKDFQVTLKNGGVVAISFDKDANFAGATSFGTFRIQAKNIKKIVFK